MRLLFMKINFDEILDVVKNNQGKVIILRGTKCIGKTNTSIKLAEFFSYDLDITTLFYSLDMKKEDVEKIIINKSTNLIIDDTSNITINDICTNIQNLYNDNKLRFVVIDVIQLVSYNEFKNLSFDIQQQKIIDELVKLSKKLNINIFITQQIREDKTESYNVEVLK